MKKISFLIIIFITTFITAQESNQNQSDLDFGNGVSLSFEDGDYNFNINGFIKTTYVYNEMTSIVDGGIVNEINRQFKSKNSVLEISGNAKKEKVSFSIMMDYSLSNPLLEAWVGYHPSKSVNLYFGQKNTFLNNREMIFNEDILQFTARSLLSQNHTGSDGEEFGLFIETTFGEKFILSPKFAITSGDGRNSFGEDSRDSDLGGVKFGARLDLYPFGNFSEGNEGKEPINEIISTDGEYLYKLDLELDQLDILPKDDYFTNTPISIFISEIDDLKELYLVDYCEVKANQTTCLITPKSAESFMEKLFINFIENNLVSLRYLDSFNQDVKLKLNNISWSSFEQSDLKISIPEGIDVVYH